MSDDSNVISLLNLCFMSCGWWVIKLNNITKEDNLYYLDNVYCKLIHI
jgi:hypothetical protein